MGLLFFSFSSFLAENMFLRWLEVIALMYLCLLIEYLKNKWGLKIGSSRMARCTTFLFPALALIFLISISGFGPFGNSMTIIFGCGSAVYLAFIEDIDEHRCHRCHKLLRDRHRTNLTNKALYITDDHNRGYLRGSFVIDNKIEICCPRCGTITHCYEDPRALSDLNKTSLNSVLSIVLKKAMGIEQEQQDWDDNLLDSYDITSHSILLLSQFLKIHVLFEDNLIFDWLDDCQAISALYEERYNQTGYPSGFSFSINQLKAYFETSVPILFSHSSVEGFQLYYKN